MDKKNVWEKSKLKHVKKKRKRSVKLNKIDIEICNFNTTNNRRKALIEKEIDLLIKIKT